MRKIFQVVLVASMMLCCGLSFAQDFGIALKKDLSKIPDGADAGSVGNANTALIEFTSRVASNIPAQVTEKNGCVLGTYGNIGFRNGQSINFYVVSTMLNLPVGTMQVYYANGGSNTGTVGEDKLKFDHFPNVGVQYGVQVSKNLFLKDDALYVGVGYDYSSMKLTGRSVVDTPDGPFSIDLKSRSASNTVSTSVLYRTKLVNVVSYFAHSWDVSHDSVNGVTDTTKGQTDQLRLGVSAKLTESTLVALDYRHLYLEDHLHDDQYFVGLEQYVLKGVVFKDDSVALYGGWADGGTTAGIGMYHPRGGINLAYMHWPFRNLEEFFGKSNIYMASLYFTF